jgi:hypothetical protein
MLVLMGSDSRAAEQRDELASLQLIELHSAPRQLWPNCRISNWRRIVSGVAVVEAFDVRFGSIAAE